MLVREKQEKPTSAPAVRTAKGREEGRGGPRQIRAEENAALLQPETGVQALHKPLDPPIPDEEFPPPAKGKRSEARRLKPSHGSPYSKPPEPGWPLVSAPAGEGFAQLRAN